jgi:hypothetical protein
MNLTPEQTKVEAGGNYAKAEVHEKTSLLVSIVALFFSGIAVGLLIAICLLVPQLLEARIQAAIAPANERASIAAQDAAIAKNTVQKLEARLNERR